MMYKPLALALSLIPAVLGQLYPPPAGTTSSSTTSSSSAAASSSTGSTDAAAGQVLVQVGQGGGFSFSPSSITASVGTLVTFVFGSSIPHSVTESNFADPCTPLPNGFDSGLTEGGTTFSVNVTDASSPIYFFCKFPGHCGSLGMVGAINAPASGNGSVASFVAAAKAVGSGESAITDTAAHTGGVGAVATAGPTTGTPTVASPSPTGSSGSSSSSSSTSAGATNTNAAAPLNAGNALGLLSVVAGLFAFVF